MKAIEVNAAHPSDECRMTETIVLAFASDPAARWMYPDPQQYFEHFPAFVQAFGGRAFAAGTAQCADHFRAAALWLPPGVHPDDDAVMDLIARSISGPHQEALFATFDQMASFHPAEPHWHLPLIGVEPQAQRKGYGAALLHHALMLCDQQGMPAYLESSNVRNIPLYQRHGFEVLSTIQVGSSPPITPMLRRPH